MKTRAECLEKYGSDYFIEKKIEKGEDAIPDEYDLATTRDAAKIKDKRVKMIC